MIIKEKIPITFFEKMKSAVDILCPSFFTRSVPDMVELNKQLSKDAQEATWAKNNNVTSLKKLMKMNEAFKNTHQIKLNHLRKEMNIIEGLSDDLEKRKEKNGLKDKDLIKGDEAWDFLDALYMANSPHYINDEGNIQPLNHAKDRKDIDRMFWTLHRFNKYGKKTFRIEEQLTHELFLTDVNNVDSDFLRFPFPSICFYLPFNNKLCIRKEIIRYVYISERLRVGGESDNVRIVELLYITDKEDIEVQQFEISDGPFINQVLSQIETIFNSPLGKKEASGVSSFILAAILYLNSTDSDQLQVFPIFWHKNHDSKFPVCSLGYDISIDKGLHYAQNPETEGLGKPMNVLKWTVRGHFRSYRRGEHWKEDRTIWIRPFLKGREKDNDGQIIKPTNYLVQ
jgi:hypothetical protein